MPSRIEAAPIGTAGKLERIRQLADCGLNTPRLVKIPAGTLFDDALRARLRDVAAGDPRMTVRTYHPTDEIAHAKGPFFPEVPTDEAIAIAEELVRDWNVLFQEAIDVADTRLAGNVILDSSGSGVYEALAGKFRVRDVEEPPLEAADAFMHGAFQRAAEIPVVEIRDLVERVCASGLFRDLVEERIAVEFNVQEHPVGRRRETTLFWEWRPVGRAASAAPLETGSALEDGGVYGVGLRDLPAPSGESDDARALGGKGLSLVRMNAASLPVPPAVVFAVPPVRVAGDLPRVWARRISEVVAALRATGCEFVSVRSSPTVSMPGMLETVLAVELRESAIRAAMGVVLNSWWAERAVAYRANRGLEHAGLAIVVQAMVDATRGARSGSGVGFTRDPRTGTPTPVIEWSAGRRGEEIVGGRITPLEGSELARAEPGMWSQLTDVAAKLEAIFGDMQEFEFVVDNEKLFLLQSRSSKRTGLAAVRVAHDLWAAGVIDHARAARLLAGIDLGALVEQRLVTDGVTPLASSRVASPGAAAGRIALTRERAEVLADQGEPTVLCTETTSPLDYPVVPRLAGLLTRRGGVTSHAAVVALEAGTVALVGCHAAEISVASQSISFGGVVLKEGDWISLDGTTGLIYRGRLPQASGTVEGLSGELVDWARSVQLDVAA